MESRQTLEHVYSNSRWAIATHHHRGKYRLPTAEGVEKILDQDVDLVVPDGRLLKGEVPDAWRTTPPVGFRTCSVLGRRNASAEEARHTAERYGSRVRPAIKEDDEVQWVGARLGADNRTEEWLGGSQATFLRKP